MLRRKGWVTTTINDAWLRGLSEGLTHKLFIHLLSQGFCVCIVKIAFWLGWMDGAPSPSTSPLTFWCVAAALVDELCIFHNKLHSFNFYADSWNSFLKRPSPRQRTHAAHMAGRIFYWISCPNEMQRNMLSIGRATGPAWRAWPWQSFRFIFWLFPVRCAFSLLFADEGKEWKGKERKLF